MTLTFRRKDRETVMERLPGIIEKCRGELLDREIAEHEWEKRFKVMLVKRLGPGLVPMEVVFPLSSLAGVIRDIEEKIAQPVVKEGIVIRKGSSGEPEVAGPGRREAEEA